MRYYLLAGDRWIGDYSSPEKMEEAKKRLLSTHKDYIESLGNFWVIKGERVIQK